MRRSYEESGISFRMIAAFVWILPLAGMLLPLVPSGAPSQTGACTMACCRLQNHAPGERCRCCSRDEAPTKDVTMNCYCRIKSQVAVLVPLPPAVLVAAPAPAQTIDQGRYDAIAIIFEDSGFIPTPFRPPNVRMI